LRIRFSVTVSRSVESLCPIWAAQTAQQLDDGDDGDDGYKQ